MLFSPRKNGPASLFREVRVSHQCIEKQSSEEKEELEVPRLLGVVKQRQMPRAHWLQEVLAQEGSRAEGLPLRGIPVGILSPEDVRVTPPQNEVALKSSANRGLPLRPGEPECLLQGSKTS